MELSGATDSALGNIEANNTSAILALQEKMVAEAWIRLISR